VFVLFVDKSACGALAAADKPRDPDIAFAFFAWFAFPLFSG
jgi:hypothetical protein